MDSVPIGLRLSQAARVCGRAFDEALQRAGGSLPVWLILLNLKIRRPQNQRELAEAVGITEATLTHHLNGLDSRGLLTRRRDTANRRIHVVELTEAGEKLFRDLQHAALAFDARLRTGLSQADVTQLDGLLGRLIANVGGADEAAMPWAGLCLRLALPPFGGVAATRALPGGRGRLCPDSSASDHPAHRTARPFRPGCPVRRGYSGGVSGSFSVTCSLRIPP